jgi:chromosome segregation ATPase
MVEALQEQATSLQAQVTALGQQLAALSLQMSTADERLAAAETRAARAEAEAQSGIVSLELTVAAQAETLDAQAGEIATLKKAAEGHEEAIKQLRGHLARLERQAAIDLDEMRQTDIAIAASVLLNQRSVSNAPIDAIQSATVAPAS